ncbi:hypothetical protein [Streptosporangium sp. NPDC002721]|uniref:hypothetical protein n=1 Tax=Streptosporangium sp. NPDC002721 TaxID=3366188 RepID=UPI00367B30B1
MIVLIRIYPPTRGSAVVPNDVADVESLPEWSRLVAEAVSLSGRKGSTIAARSVQVAKVFSELDSDLEGGCLDEFLLSRMRNGKIQKPRWEKLILLKLTLLYLDDRSCSDLPARREAALAEAVVFAKRVLATAVPQTAKGAAGSRRPDARHERTVELLEAYGEDLLRQVGESGTGEAEAKLALLHQLGGNSDDARYWSGQAFAVDPNYVHASSQQELFSRAHYYATGYQRAFEPKIAYLYWKYAAESGDGIAAFRLGQMAELKGDLEDAANWRRIADSLGYSSQDQYGNP